MSTARQPSGRARGYERLSTSRRALDQLGCHVMPIELDLPDLGPAQQTIVLCEAAVGMLPRCAEWEQTIFPPTRKMLPNADKLTYHDLVPAQSAAGRVLGKVLAHFRSIRRSPDAHGADHRHAQRHAGAESDRGTHGPRPVMAGACRAREHDVAAGREHAGRLRRAGLAGRATNHRPAARRMDGAPPGKRLRSRASLGRQAPPLTA